MASPRWRPRIRDLWAKVAAVVGVVVFGGGLTVTYYAAFQLDPEDKQTKRYDLTLPAPDPLPEFTPKPKEKTDAETERPRPKPSASSSVGSDRVPAGDSPVHPVRTQQVTSTPTPTPTFPPTRPVTPIPTSQPASEPTLTPAPVNVSQRAQVILLMNQQRANFGLPPLSSSSALGTSAQQWSEQMAAEGRMYHSQHAPENVAWGYPDAASVMAAWMASPGHRANILDPNSTLAGVGLSGTYWTVQFQ